MPLMVNKNARELPLTRKAPVRPIYIRLPRPREHCPYTGMSRSGLADICVANKANGFRPPVRSIYLKKNKYAKRGIRLIEYASLMKYLRSEFAAHKAA
jgi:hypothetical protein